MKYTAQGSIVVKLAETEEPLNSPSQEHQVGQILIQMATVRDIDQDPSTASEDYTKVVTASLTCKHLVSFETLRCLLCQPNICFPPPHHAKPNYYIACCSSQP